MSPLNINSWILLFDLYRKGEFKNVQLSFNGRSFNPHDIVIPYTGRTIGEISPEDCLPGELTMMLDPFMVREMSEGGSVVKTVLSPSSSGFSIIWNHLN